MALFRGLQGDVERSLLWVTVFVTVVAVVSQGLARGLVPSMLVLVMLLFTGLAMLVLLGPWPTSEAGRAAVALHGGRITAVLTQEAWLAALRHALYTLAVATGVVVSLTAYLPERVSMVQAGLLVIALDLMAAVLGSVVVLSLLHHAGLPVVSGPALVFQVLPVAIGQMSGSGNSCSARCSTWCWCWRRCLPALPFWRLPPWRWWSVRALDRGQAAISPGAGALAFGHAAGVVPGHELEPSRRSSPFDW
jgi:SNF family Na+-dependent transporter